MRGTIKWGLRAVGLVAVLVLAVGVWKQDELKRLLAVNSLFEQDEIVENFSHMDRAFLTNELALSSQNPTSLPSGQTIDVGEDVNDWVIARDVTSLLIMHDGNVVFEDYFLQTTPQDRRISWSVSKSFLSALLGIVLDSGQITSLDDPVTTYAPSLVGSAYDGVTIHDVLVMSSGVAFDEDYLDYYSDINRMGRVLALGRSMDAFTESLTERTGPAGEAWQYVSIDTHVLGMVIRGATGRDIPDLMTDNLLGPMGLERPPFYLTDGNGTAFVLGGLNLTTRDMARMGQMYLQRGFYNGMQIIPADWAETSTMASAKTQVGEYGYGYQWWIPKDAEPGEFMARGIYGQYIYVNRNTDTVIASTAADRMFRDEGVADLNIAIFRQISDRLTATALEDGRKTQ